MTCPRPHRGLFSAQLRAQYCLPYAQSHLPLILARKRPCFLPLAILPQHSNKPLSLCPPQAPPSHPLSPFRLPLGPQPIPLLCRSSVAEGRGGERVMVGPVRRGPWGGLGMEHCGDPRGAGAGSLRAGSLRAAGTAGPNQAALGGWWFNPQRLAGCLTFYFTLSCEQFRPGTPPQLCTQPSSLPSWQRPAPMASQDILSPLLELRR